jgi:hypothetical protein
LLGGICLVWGIYLIWSRRRLGKETIDSKQFNIKTAKFRWRCKQFRTALQLSVIFALLNIFVLAIDMNMTIRWAALICAVCLALWKFGKNCLHLMMPRLLAAIATAWFTIALSEDLFKAFFDKPISIISVTLLSVVIAAFLFSEIDKLTPHCTFIKKSLRVVELMMIGYAISLLIGFMMVNFTGDYLLERSGYMEQYLREYPEKFNLDVAQHGLTHYELLEKLVQNEEFEHVDRYSFHRNGYRFFVLRNFLIQFALMAMFIGVFLQMSFEDKQLTES